MNEALCSILYGEDVWHFDWGYQLIKFNKDGTGRFWCCADMCWWVVLELEWKSLLPSPPDEVIDQTSSATRTRNSNPQLLGQLKLEITLTKRMVEGLGPAMIMSDHGLLDDAFRAKPFTVKMEKGNFTEPMLVGYGDSNHKPRYALRLLFDKSPYPPREEWKSPEGAPDSIRFWDKAEFVGRRSRELDKTVTAMNDVSPGWGSCVVC